MKLSTYVKLERGRARLMARELGVSESLVAQWARGKPVAAHKCPAIEKFTDGVVGRRDLRPDDWAEIWPELQPAHAQHSAAHA